MDKFNLYSISVGGVNTPKGCRKPRAFREHIERVAKEDYNEAIILEHVKHIVNNKTRVTKATIYVNEAYEDGEMVFTKMLPFKTIALEVQQ